MRRLELGIATAVMAASLWGAENIKMPASLDELSHRATESVDVTLDAPLLHLASQFLSADDPDEARVKKLISRLKGIYVRSFEFDKDGQYAMSDVEAVRAQLKGSGWSRIVGVKSLKGENSEVYLKRNADQIAGLVVLSAEPKELTVVVIDGPIDPEQLSELGGHLGIPKLGRSKSKDNDDNPKSNSKRDDDE
jgi:Domain of unknown function (DUF4252)